MAKTRKAIRRIKDKDPNDLVWRKDQAQREIELLQRRLDFGLVSEHKIPVTELRLCKLMNETIPKFERRIEDLLGK